MEQANDTSMLSVSQREEQVGYLIGLHTTTISAAERLNNEINLQMSLSGHHFTQDTKRDWKMLMKASNDIKFWYDKWVRDAAKGCKMIEDEGDTTDEVKMDEAIRDDGNTIAKILCLVYNATYRDNQGALKRIVDFLIEMQPEEMQVHPSIINKFKLQ